MNLLQQWSGISGATATLQAAVMRVRSSLGFIAPVIAVGLSVNHAQAQNHYEESVKVQSNLDGGFFIEDDYSATFGFECVNTGFTPQSPAAQIAPGAGDPGQSTPMGDVMHVPACWMDCSSGQCGAIWTWRFASLQDLGVWSFTCGGYQVDPTYCAGSCTPTCDASAPIQEAIPYTIDITVWNQPPTASISHSPTPAWNQSVTLDANSSDPDGGSVSRTWSITSRPSGSAKNLSSTSSETPTISFNSEDDIGDWSFRLHVDDNEGERRTFTHSFEVPNVPPNISISGATEIDATEDIDIAVTPTTDEDGGGAFDLEWELAQSPPTSTLPPQSNFCVTNPAFCSAGDSVIIIPTTDDDIGTWQFRVTATDNEGADDTAVKTIEVHNIPPEINFAGTSDIDIGETIQIETTILDDADNIGGGGLTFQWDIIQTPEGATPFVQIAFSSASSISIPTGPEHAGTWIFELTVTDDEDPPFQESVTDEFVVLVDAPAEAQIDAPEFVDLLSLPVVLSGENSLDPDSPCLTDPFRCHETLDGTLPREISAAIEHYHWELIDVPFEHFPDYVPGSVDDVFGVPAHGSQLELFPGDILPGEWTFQLTVADAEGNADSTTARIEIVDPDIAPFAIALPTFRRYEIDALNSTAVDIQIDGSASYDLDNILTGDTLAGGVGITDYTWTALAGPPGCTSVVPPSGAADDVFTLFSAGSAVPVECHGTWSVELAVTDDDVTPRSATTEVALTIGNCPTQICIDYPTQLMPELVEFTDETDILIYYHVDSALYANPLFSFGAFVQLSIFHESDLATPVYTDIDPNVLPSAFGGVLSFHWNGFSNAGLRPEPGRYTVQLDIRDSALGATAVSAVELDAIIIAVAEPEILPGSEIVVDREKLEAASDTLAVDWEIVGSATADAVRIRIYDSSDVPVFTDALPLASNGTYLWDGQIGGTSVAVGEYTAEVEALRGGSVLGTSDRHHFTVYTMNLIAVSNDLGVMPPEQFVALNGDDDDGNGTADFNDAGPAPFEDDLQQLELQFDPLGAPLRLRLVASAGGGNAKIWELADKTIEIALPDEWDLATVAPPWLAYSEGVADGDTHLELILADTAGTTLDTRELNLHVTNVDLDIDTTMDGTVDLADDSQEVSDKAIVINVNNDSDGPGIDSHNNVVDGAADLAELTELTLRQISFVPAGGSVQISVTDAESTAASNKAKEKVRIFDHTQTGRIGPPVADGGPDAHNYIVPNAAIGGADLTYFIEAFNHGNVTVRLSVLDSAATELAYDEVKAVLNVDRTPAGGATRFRINAGHDHPTTTLEGIRGRIETPQAKVNWSPTIRMFSSTNVWHSAQHMGTATGSYWIQTGLAVDRSVGTAVGSESSAVYFEVAIHHGTAAYTRHYMLKPGGGGWPANALYSGAVENTATGEVVARQDGVQWDSWTHAEWQTRKLRNYQSGTELFHSVDQNCGTITNRCILSDIEIRDAGTWTATAYVPADLHITDFDKNGNATNPATSHEWAHTPAAAQGYEMWDKVVEY